MGRSKRQIFKSTGPTHLEQLQVQADAQGLITWDVSVDSTVCRAHQHAAGARKKGICNASRPAGSTPSPTTTASDARAAV